MYVVVGGWFCMVCGDFVDDFVVDVDVCCLGVVMG